MKSREYTEQKFIPWILFLDSYDTLKHFKDQKEEYLKETYNQISKEFRALERYELYNFKVSTKSVMMPIGLATLTVCKLPEVVLPGESAYMLILECNEKLIFYTITALINNEYQLIKFENKTKENLSVGKLDLDFFIEEIKKGFLI